MTTNTLSTVARALDILSMFKDTKEFTLNELTNELNLSKSIVYRTLHTLESKGFLIKDEKTKVYTLGYEVYRLGKEFSKNDILIKIADPIVKELHERIDETIGLVVPDYQTYSAVQIIEIETTHPVKHIPAVSRVREFHTGAARKTLLAHLDDEFINQVIEANLSGKSNQNKIENVFALRMELKKIRKQGYGESIAEIVKDVYAVSAPIFGYNEEAIGSLGIYLPIYRIRDRKNKLIKLVKKYSQKITDELI